MPDVPRILIYYFAFPHYRREILQELVASDQAEVELASGSRARADIAMLTDADLGQLTRYRTVSVGPASWDVGVMHRAVSRRYDAVILGPAVASLSTWATLIIRAILRRRTFVWGQSGRAGDRSAKRYLQELMNRLATGLLVYGAGEAAAAGDLGLPPERIHVVRNATRSNRSALESSAVEFSFDHLIAKAAAVRDGSRPLVLLFVGRLLPSKRIEILLDAVAILAETYPSIRAVIIGDGPTRAALESRFQGERYDFRGWVYDDDRLREVFEEATLVASPMHMGLLAVDALRYGVPVLVPDNPQNASEVEALQEGVNSVRFEAGSATALAAAARTWLADAGKLDRKRYASTTGEALRQWSPAAVAHAILESVIPPKIEYRGA